MPTGRVYGSGCRSVTMPTTGCSSEAVSWKVSVIAPIWKKLSANSPLSSG